MKRANRALERMGLGKIDANEMRRESMEKTLEGAGFSKDDRDDIIDSNFAMNMPVSPMSIYELRDRAYSGALDADLVKLVDAGIEKVGDILLVQVIRELRKAK